MKRESWRLGGFHFHSNPYGSYGMVTAARNGAMQEGGIHWGDGSGTVVVMIRRYWLVLGNLVILI